MNNANIENNLLHMGDMEIAFENKISQLKQEGNRFFVLLDIPAKEELCYDDYHNIYCYGNDGRKVWQIGKRPKGDDAVFTMIDMVDSVLYANDFLGRRFKVDKETGIVGDMNITK
ncbi:MAG: hypothetical protein LBP73_03880 [Clostridiales Family XIII bacterium]|jgi:hypothetical protein|nr:hypothetical protein [Clostridiales Family XIII bacterium]